MGVKTASAAEIQRGGHVPQIDNPTDTATALTGFARYPAWS